MIYILVEKNPIKPIGIFSSEAIARGQAVEGEYLIIPVDLDRRYSGGIVSEAMLGAITVKATGTELSEAVALVLGRLDLIDNRLDTIETQISNAGATLADFEARITVLEGL
jgi:hypothetical protein